MLAFVPFNPTDDFLAFLLQAMNPARELLLGKQNH